MISKGKTQIQIHDGIYLLLTTALTTICYKLFYFMCTSDTYESDFKWYINLPTSDNKERYRLLGWLFDLMYRHGTKIPGMVVYLALVIGCTVLASYVYLIFFTEKSEDDRTVLQVLSLFTPFMGPIFFPVLHEYFYRHSFQSYAWHSPTQQSMILYSTIAMICFIKLYESSDEKVSVKWWLLTMTMGLLSAFAKPAFIIALIPAMVLLFLVDLFAKSNEPVLDRFKKRFGMGTSLIPAGIYILLAMRYEFDGGSKMYEGSVVLDIRHVMEYNHLVAAIVFGLAFPITVWIVNHRLLKKKRFKSVFVLLLMGILQWMILREEGIRATHGNFGWSRQAGCHFFFLTGVAIAINNWKDSDFLADRPLSRKIYFTGIGILFLLHVASQMIYFYLICKGHSYWF